MTTKRVDPPTEGEVASLLLRGGLAFEPLTVVDLRQQVQVGAGRADFILELEWEGRRRQFAVEYKRLSTPRRLEAAILQANRNAVGDLLPMVVAPYLRPDALNRLAQTKTSGIDLSGNGIITVPGDWFVLRSGQRNRYPARSPIKAVYSGKSSLIGRTLLLSREFSSVTEVQEQISLRGASVSLGTVSKVLQALEEDLVIQRRPTIRLIQPDRLIDELRNGFRPPKSPSGVLVGRVDDQATFLDQVFESAQTKLFPLVAQSASVYSALPRDDLTLFTTDVEATLQNTSFEETTRFSNVSLIETTDELAFFDSRMSNGYLWTPPAQVYFTLANGGKREQEIADQIRLLIVAELDRLQ